MRDIHDVEVVGEDVVTREVCEEREGDTNDSTGACSKSVDTVGDVSTVTYGCYNDHNDERKENEQRSGCLPAIGHEPSVVKLIVFDKRNRSLQ